MMGEMIDEEWPFLLMVILWKQESRSINKQNESIPSVVVKDECETVRRLMVAIGNCN